AGAALARHRRRLERSLAGAGPAAARDGGGPAGGRRVCAAGRPTCPLGPRGSQRVLRRGSTADGRGAARGRETAHPAALLAHRAALFGIGRLASPIALLNPVPLKIVVDSVLGSHPLPAWLAAALPAAATRSPATLLAVAIGLLIAVAALAQVQGLANKFMQAYVGERLVLAFRTQLVQHAQRLSLSYHDSKGSADSLYRINQDAAVIDKIMVEGIIPFVAAGITLAMMIVVMTRLDWQLALVALGVSPPLV